MGFIIIFDSTNETDWWKQFKKSDYVDSELEASDFSFPYLSRDLNWIL